MNFGKKGPYILLTLLVIILIFILGVQYGKRVKIADTAISYLLSITPIPTATPVKLPPTEYTSYSHEGCRVDFLYPSYLQLKNESSREAKLLSSDNKQFIKVVCQAGLPQRPEATTSASITIDGFLAQKMEDTIQVKKDSIQAIILRINRNVIPVEFTISKELEPLVTTSVDIH